MYEVRITCIQAGVNRDALSLLLHEQTKQELSAVQACIDTVLDGNEVTLWLTSLEAAILLASTLMENGAVAAVHPPA